MIARILTKKLTALAKKFPVISLTGPRQSGKTTLLRHQFPKYKYVSLENPDSRRFANRDPHRFLNIYSPPSIIDEAQEAPEIFSYIQTLTDETGKPGQYFLSGSQNFLLLERITQSLAGRVAIFTLLPLCLEELLASANTRLNLDDFLFTGGFPKLWDKKIKPNHWFPSYIQTYLERDVRQVVSVVELTDFHRFLKLCAGRTGQLLNISSLANDAGISHRTAKSWLSVLEASYAVFFLHPYYANLNKRLVKSPKLYFWDTGLACSLLGITSADQLQAHPLRGALFETMVIAELRKHLFHHHIWPNDVYFLRDKLGREVDFFVEKNQKLLMVEVKSGQTVNPDFFDNLKFWQPIIKSSPPNSFVIYGGGQTQPWSQATVLGWKHLAQVFNRKPSSGNRPLHRAHIHLRKPPEKSTPG